jgi:hypothetical protein
MKKYSKLKRSMSVVALVLAVSNPVFANIANWTTVGNSGVSTANDGVVIIPTGFSSVDWISTAGGVMGNNGGYGGTNGSTVTSNAFSVNAAGSALTFSFDFITSDGTTTFPDYAWSNLYNASTNSLVATLFTATTNPNGSAVPGSGAGLPTISATINPATVTVATGTGSTVWSPLGAYSGLCYAGYGNGCGNTGWVNASYNISNAGSYYLNFGVANASDTLYDSGLAFVGTAVNGTPISPVPEPGEWLMMLSGLGLVGFIATRRKNQGTNMTYA